METETTSKPTTRLHETAEAAAAALCWLVGRLDDARTRRSVGVDVPAGVVAAARRAARSALVDHAEALSAAPSSALVKSLLAKTAVIHLSIEAADHDRDEALAWAESLRRGTL